MKKCWIGCMAALCVLLSGCAGSPQESGEPEMPEQVEPRLEEPEPASGVPSREGEPEPEATPEEDAFSGRWQAVESPQYEIEITGGDGGTYAIEAVWSGASQGNIVWQATGAYDEAWNGVAYVGAKYEEIVQEDGSASRVPVPEREEVTGMVCLEEDGTLRWIDDFDHAGDELSFVRE